MQENKTTIQARGCIQLGDLLIFAFGSFIMFGKTADLLGKFAPDDWFGFSSSDYGLAAALLIEGFLIWRKVKMWLLPPKNFVEWGMDLITTFIPFALSIAAQVIDGYVTTGLINSMSDEQKTTITTVVAALVGIPLFLDIAKTAVDNAPPGIFDDIKSDTDNALGSLVGWLGTMTKKKTPVSSNPTPMNSDVRQSNLKLSNKNGKKEEEEPQANP
jgi:hypothetical protein